MSFFKKWGKGPSNKKVKAKEKENTDDRETADNGSDDDFELPPSLALSRDRGMSISRSGRHKMKTRQRASVVHGEVYAQEAAAAAAAAAAAKKNSPHSGQMSAWPAQGQHTRNTSGSKAMATSHSQSGMSSGGGVGGYYRETVDTSTKTLSGSQRMATAPTAV